MENNNTDIQTGTQTGAEGTQEKTFTQCCQSICYCSYYSYKRYMLQSDGM